MTLVDTNVLMYAANPISREHPGCRRLLESLRSSPLPWFMTWPIFYEFLRVITHRNVFEEPWNAAAA